MSTEPRMSISISLTPMPHGSEGSMRTPMALFASTFPRAPISPKSHSWKLGASWIRQLEKRRKRIKYFRNKPKGWTPTKVVATEM